MHPSWADWLWRRGLQKEETTQLQSAGVVAYCCNPNPESLKEDLSQAVASGLLTLPGEEESIVAAVKGGGYG